MGNKENYLIREKQFIENFKAKYENPVKPRSFFLPLKNPFRRRPWFKLFIILLNFVGFTVLAGFWSTVTAISSSFEIDKLREVEKAFLSIGDATPKGVEGFTAFSVQAVTLYDYRFYIALGIVLVFGIVNIIAFLAKTFYVSRKPEGI